jgi:hypothetical protein
MILHARDLRLGNLVSENDINGNVQFIRINLRYLELLEDEPGLFDPILLTMELLKNCEFEDVSNGIGLKLFEGYAFIKYLNKFPLILEIDGRKLPLHEVQYLHQLQNIYFALTGMELLFSDLKNVNRKN